MPLRIRITRTALVVLLVAALTVVASALQAQTSAAAPTTWQTVDVRLLDHRVLKPGQSVTVSLPVPTSATHAKLVVAGQLSWRPSKISVCSGSTATSRCTARPALTTPVRKAGFAHVTVDLAGAGRKVTVHNSSASTSVTIRLASWGSAGTGAVPTATATPTAKPTATATATARPTATATPSASASPVPTVAPVASPTPSPTRATPTPTPTVVAAPAASPSTSGQPGPGNTGVPAGTRLKVHEGDLKITQPNTVIDSLEVRGIVWVRAPGVVIRNSLITGRKLDSSLSLVYAGDPGVSVTIEDSELYAKDPTPHVRGIIGSNFTLKRVNMHHVIDHMAITGDNVLVESSWLHDTLYYDNDPYYDGTPTHDDNAQIAIGNNITFRKNTLSGTHNAAIQVTQDRGVVSNLTLDGNWINDGACSVNLAQNKFGPVQGVVIKNNVFTRSQVHSGCAIIADNATIPQVSLNGNVWSDGKPVSSIQGRETGQKGGS